MGAIFMNNLGTPWNRSKKPFPDYLPSKYRCNRNVGRHRDRNSERLLAKLISRSRGAPGCGGPAIRRRIHPTPPEEGWDVEPHADVISQCRSSAARHLGVGCATEDHTSNLTCPTIHPVLSYPDYTNTQKTLEVSTDYRTESIHRQRNILEHKFKHLSSTKMDTIKKVLHPKESTHHKDAHPPTSTSEQLPPDARPEQETLDRLGSEPNVTGTNRPPPHEDFPPAHHHTSTSTSTATGDQPKINRGQHQPRQPVGTRTGNSGPDATALDARVRAEADNNFPGTNPHPSHSA